MKILVTYTFSKKDMHILLEKYVAEETHTHTHLPSLFLPMPMPLKTHEAANPRSARLQTLRATWFALRKILVTRRDLTWLERGFERGDVFFLVVICYDLLIYAGFKTPY